MENGQPAEFYLMGLEASKFLKSGKDSWRGPCPRCAGHRRLLVFTSSPFPKWHVMCDLCGFKAWADEMNPRLKKQWTPEERAEYAKKQAEAEKHKDEERRKKLAAFSDSEIAAEYHERMTLAQRKAWESAGVPTEWQDYFTLGYTVGRTFAHDGSPFVSDAMTIPIFDWGRKPVNMQYRITNPPQGVGRYRQEPGLPSAAFISNPDRSEFTDEVIVVEGAKKAMVLCIYGDQNVMTVGIPGARSWAGVVEKLQNVGRVYVILDPDAQKPAHDLCRAIGKNARQITFPEKPDDLILRQNDDFSLRSVLRQGRIISA